MKKINRSSQTVVIQHPQRTSYSAWSTYQQCPQKYLRRYINKEPETQGYAAVRGEDAHAKAEHFLLGNITGMPVILKDFANEFKALKKASPQVETWLSVTRDWKPATRVNSWIVGKTDAHLLEKKHLDIIDFKTGKVYLDKHALQGSLYAAMGSGQFKVSSVHVEFWYLDHNDMLSWDYTAADLQKEREEWTVRVVELQKAQEFPCRVTPLCKWCDYSNKHNGGTCMAG